MRKEFGDKTLNVCDECGSEYFATASKMASLCPECSHILYGYENCQHFFEDDRCVKCFWNGSVSVYTKDVKNK
jgi:predicted RNA-binding Zn-ribbon protein involved in translation (DUF1610 family)